MKKYIILLLTCLTFHCCELVNPTSAPKADFKIIYGEQGLVKFNLFVTDSESYHWDFGDGDTSNGRFPTHTYNKNGRYIVRLKVKGKGGNKLISQPLTVTNVDP